MATIIPGNEGTFKSDTAEGRLLEVAAHLQILETSGTANPQGLRQLNLSLNLRNGTYSGSFQLPTTVALLPTGGISVVAAPYLVGSAVIAGSGNPTIKSLTAEGQLLEVLMLLQSLERQVGRNPNNRNYVTGSLDSETGQFSGQLTVPIQASLSAEGDLVVTAVPYLVD